MDMVWIAALLLLPALGSIFCLALRAPYTILRVTCAVVLVTAAVGVFAAGAALTQGAVLTASDWLRLDALSAYHLLVMLLVYSLCSIYALRYFASEINSGELTSAAARRFGMLWLGSMAAMVLVLVSNNLGVLWVGVEATTLCTAFLICLHATSASLEAMWKYLLMCSVGVAFAFLGTLLVAAAAAPAGLHGSDALLWTRLMNAAPAMNIALLKAGFLFLVVGFGTKAGLAPMHNWLPDAHSQAPAPVSAMFSGFLLNSAFYCVLRHLALVEAATADSAWGRDVLIVLGLVSIVVAAAFLVRQQDLKRLLAYSSVEHIGIIALGVGLGGVGVFAALLHTLNHSLGKSLAFFSAGRLGQIHGTLAMERIRDVLRRSPAWGAGLTGGLLALAGAAPFAPFLSEFLVLQAAVARAAYVPLTVFLLGLGIAFTGVLRYLIPLAWAPAEDDVMAAEPEGALAGALAAVILIALVVLGLWLPVPLQAVLGQATVIAGGSAP